MNPKMEEQPDSLGSQKRNERARCQWKKALWLKVKEAIHSCTLLGSLTGDLPGGEGGVHLSQWLYEDQEPDSPSQLSFPLHLPQFPIVALTQDPGIQT